MERRMLMKGARALAAAVLSVVDLQLFVTVMSLPICVSWGLPLSLLSLVGNVIFLPFLTCALFLASLIFIAQICHLPHRVLQLVFEMNAALWTQCMGVYAHKTIFIAYRKPPLLLLCLLLAIFLYILQKIVRMRPLYRIIAYSSVIFFLLGFDACISSFSRVIHLTCGKRGVALMVTPTVLALVDSGGALAAATAPSFVDYTLSPLLVENAGRVHVDVLVLPRLSSRNVVVIQRLITKLGITELYVPRGAFTRTPWWHSFAQWLDARCVHLHCLEACARRELHQKDILYICVEAGENKTTSQHLDYHVQQVRGTIGNRSVDVYQPPKQ